MALNKCILHGNLTRDIECRYTPKGTAIANFGLAINRRWKGEDGEEKEEVVFVDCEAWGKQAETLAQYLRKGDQLLMEGRLKLDQWDDKKTGEKRSKLKVVLETFSFVGSKKDGGERSEQAPQSSGYRTAAPAKPRDDDFRQEEPPADDDVPF